LIEQETVERDQLGTILGPAQRNGTVAAA